MNPEEVIRLLKKGDVKTALEKAGQVDDKKKMADLLSDFAGVLAETKGHPELCKAILLKSILLDPENSDTYYNLGNVMSMTQILISDSDNAFKAIRWYDRALEKDEGNLEARYNKALLLFLMGKPEEAEIEYGLLMAKNPGHVKYKELGHLLKSL